MIISEMQDKLARWSTEDKTRKFDRLLRLIASKEWLAEAAHITLESTGARTPGVDRVDRIQMLACLEETLETIRIELLNGIYLPLPARRIYIPKSNGKLRPLGIPSLRDRIVQRAMLMVMEPIWESDFHRDSYGFRTQRSVHHAIRAVQLQLQDSTDPAGRWVVEGDLASYFDTVHHKLLMKCVRKRICDQRFLDLLWQLLKAGSIDEGIFLAAHEGVPQGGVLSPLLSNIMLHEFDEWLDKKYLSKKARIDRWYWNQTIKDKRPKAILEGRQWRPAVSYCRYADDFVLLIKGTKAQAEILREECRQFLETDLKLTLNLDKTHVTHVNDGFVFLGHRLIRTRGPKGKMRVITQIPKEKFKNFAAKMTIELSGKHHIDKLEMVSSINRKIRGWVNFYQYTDFTAMVFNKMDQIIFWKLGYWFAKKYRLSLKELIKRWVRYPRDGGAKTWSVFGKGQNGKSCGVTLCRLVGKTKKQFRWKTPQVNPFIIGGASAKTLESRYQEIVIAMSRF